MKALLLWSHGQATVERGFSVGLNARLKVDNLTEDAFVAKRLICDHVVSVGGLQNVDCSNKKLLMKYSSTRQKYMAYHDDQKTKECSGRGEKRKALTLIDEIDELKKKKMLQVDVDAMVTSADEYTEKTYQTTWILSPREIF